MRIGWIYTGAIVNSYYRSIVPRRELQRRGHTMVWSDKFTFGSKMSQLPDCELAHVHRCMGEDDLDLIRRMRAHGIAVVWDNDDNIDGLSRSDRRSQGLSKRETRRHFERSVVIAKTANLMTTPSPYIADLYRNAGVENAIVIENCVAASDLKRARRPHTGVVIGCVAGSEHVADLKRLRIARTLEAILRSHPETCVVAVGLDLKLASSRYEHCPNVPVERLVEYETRFDIGIAPLVDSPFSRGRSNVKLKEYAVAGAMWLASPIGPYVGMGEEQGGLLVADGDWHDTLTALVQDHERRRELTERAREWASRASMEQSVRAWEQSFKTTLRRARAVA